MFQESTKKTNLSELGEFALIEKLTNAFTVKNQTTQKGIGDDAAVINVGKELMLISTDMLVEGIHFDLVYSPLKHLGFKAISTNVSDIAAMNGIAKQVTVSLAVSSKYTIEALEELYQGIWLACEKFKVDLIGGDTTSSPTGLTISITVVGTVDPEKIVYRNTAKENDLIVVSGDLGGAYVGLQILEREKQVYLSSPGIQPELEGFDYILERQLKPEARVDLKELFEKLEVLPTSMIDVSDGLSSELHHICKQSNLGCVIFEEKIPIDPTTYQTARDLNLDPTVCALNGGEDYELLFTIPLNEYDKIKGNPNFTVIGHTTDKNSGLNLHSKSGTIVPILAQGWNSFNTNSH